MQIEKALGGFIEKEIAYDRDQARFGPDDALLDGVLDSMDMLKLVVFIEDEFHVTVGDDELVPENFTSIRTLAEFVRSKQAAA